jgi:hypothetical protein
MKTQTVELTLKEIVHLDNLLWTWHLNNDPVDGPNKPTNLGIHLKMLDVMKEYDEDTLDSAHIELYNEFNALDD